MLYCNHRRPIIMKESPGKLLLTPEIKLTDVSKIIGEEWKMLNDKQRTVRPL
jgi:hypothetical protein